MNARITFKNIPLHKLTNFSFKDVTAACKSFIENAGASECVIVQTASRVEVFTVGGVQMGEPEFFLMDTGPVKPILTGDEIEEITRKVQTPKDQTPQYNPENVLSPEFGGGSSYETGLTDLIEDAKQKLNRLLNDPETTQQEIELAKLDLKKLNYLYDNYNLGMNVFRTAKGGRDTLRE